MPISHTWSPLADRHLLHMRAAGLPWRVIAAELQVGRNAAIERARRLGVRVQTRMMPAPRPTPEPAPAPARNDRAPLPAGHPITWCAITDGTPLDGSPYPHPVFL